MSIYLLVAPSILLHAGYTGLRVLLPLFALHLGASPLIVGAIMSLLGLLPMIFAVATGRFIDRIGIRRPMLVGTWTTVGGLLLGAVYPSLEILFLVSAIVGIGFSFYHIAVNHAAGSLGPVQDRVKNFSLVALSFSTSNVIGPLTIGFVIDELGFRSAFLVLTASAIVALIVLLAIKIDVPQHPTAAAGKSRSWTDLLREKSMRRVFLVTVSLSIAWDLFSFMVPIHGSRIGLSASQIGVILGAFGIAIFAVRLLTWLGPRVSEWRVLTVSMIASGITLFVFPLVHTAPVLVFLAFVLGFALGGSQPIVMTLLYAHAAPGRGGEAIGVRTVLINFSQASMPLMFGALGTALGMTPVFWTIALLLAGTGYWVRKR